MTSDNEYKLPDPLSEGKNLQEIWRRISLEIMPILSPTPEHIILKEIRELKTDMSKLQAKMEEMEARQQEHEKKENERHNIIRTIEITGLTRLFLSLLFTLLVVLCFYLTEKQLLDEFLFRLITDPISLMEVPK